ncbi:hypothetical protein BGZ61DRAFT_536238 [Ilyonectria robusta]|uniref:uncharacterized protein n=1 Tax=Ilyonectria robusta TaxID=1079257 RepID=UPI001E8D198B|nr:uncharacterized protein BGZ61DRAFT_536238 [Ilyonectria robusta]KAH8674932.1 hypothetical protein BGZ61DRAFT_536238 [Ilyonectria robusta]
MLHSLLAIANLTALTTARCYYPDGSEATEREYEPCGGVNTTFSTCCVFSDGEECLPNGLCTYPGHYDYRGACNNEDWEGCAEICPTTSSDGWVQVKQCTTDGYCCNVEREGNCCEDGTDRFSLEERPSTRSSMAPSTSTTAIATSPVTETADVPNSKSTDAMAIAKPAKRSSVDKSSSTPVGLVAVGVVGGVLGVVGIGLWAFLRQRRKKAALAGLTASGSKSVSGSELSEIKEVRRPKRKRPKPNRPVELDAGPDHVVAEAEGDSPRHAERRREARRMKKARLKWIAELDAGPGQVIAEADSRPVHVKRREEVHEMAA